MRDFDLYRVFEFSGRSFDLFCREVVMQPDRVQILGIRPPLVAGPPQIRRIRAEGIHRKFVASAHDDRNS
ncbi:MAG: hypothetical protein EA351_00515 [Gemmatimonadales bacterium]|nr:MAG: hypothetical protein EA351_00515 [Gemmatimonadales bacterium]